MRRLLLALALALPQALFAAVDTTVEACPKVSLDIFLLVDTSGSMEGTWQTLATALDRFAADMGPDDRLTLATFSHEGTYKVVERVGGDKVAQITAHLRSIQIERPLGTDILGALRRAAPEVRGRGGGLVEGMARVPILLVLTDGQDTNEEVIETLVNTGIPAGDQDTDTEGANVARLYRVTEDTLQGWADLWAEALGGQDGAFPLSMIALFDHPIPDAGGRPIPGTGGVRRHFVEMVRLRPDLNLHLVDLERGMTLPIGVICAVPTHLDFGNIPDTLSEPREVRFMVRGRSGVMRLPTPDEVRLGFLGDPEMLRGGAGATMEAEAGSTPGSLALRLRLVNPDNLSPAEYTDNKVTLALPNREDSIIFLVPDRLHISFRTDLEPTECPIAAAGPATVVKGGPPARKWESERLLTPDCRDAAGAAGLTIRAFGLPKHAQIVVEDGFGQEVARLSRSTPTGRLPAIGDLTTRLIFPRPIRFEGEVGVTLSTQAANLIYQASGEGIEVARAGVRLTWDVSSHPPLPWWVWALLALLLLAIALLLRPTFRPRARVVFSLGIGARPVRAARHPGLFGPATCVLQEREGGVGALEPPGRRGIATFRATRSGAAVTFSSPATKDGNPLKRGAHHLLEGVTYQVGNLSFTWEGGRRRPRRR